MLQPRWVHRLEDDERLDALLEQLQKRAPDPDADTTGPRDRRVCLCVCGVCVCWCQSQEWGAHDDIVDFCKAAMRKVGAPRGPTRLLPKGVRLPSPGLSVRVIHWPGRAWAHEQ